MSNSSPWPEPNHDDLARVVEAFKARSKTIHYSGKTDSACGKSDGMEWFGVVYSSNIPDQPEVQLSLREDLFADVWVRSRKRKVKGKKLLRCEAIYLQLKPEGIVEAFLSTIHAGTTKAYLASALEQWSALEKRDLGT